MSIMDVPKNENSFDPIWQDAYYEGMDDYKPTSTAPLYISGWLHGYCGGFQCSQKEAIEAYHEHMKGATP